MNWKEYEFKDVEAESWKPFKKGDCIKGILINVEESVGANNSKAYFVENENGINLVWGSTILDTRMNLVKVGDVLNIIFEGMDKNNKGQDLKLWRVQKGEWKNEPKTN